MILSSSANYYDRVGYTYICYMSGDKLWVKITLCAPYEFCKDIYAIAWDISRNRYLKIGDTIQLFVLFLLNRLYRPFYTYSYGWNIYVTVMKLLVDPTAVHMWILLVPTGTCYRNEVFLSTQRRVQQYLCADSPALLIYKYKCADITLKLGENSIYLR